MGTRSLTFFVEDGKKIAVAYRQMDGYPSGHGRDLANLIGKIRIGNGIGGGCTRETYANGMGDLAAWIVGKLKGDDLGHVYLYPTDTKYAGQEYEYTLSEGKDGEFTVKCCEVLVTYKQDYSDIKSMKRKTLFDGTPAKFLEWLDAEQASAAN